MSTFHRVVFLVHIVQYHLDAWPMHDFHTGSNSWADHIGDCLLPSSPSTVFYFVDSAFLGGSVTIGGSWPTMKSIVLVVTTTHDQEKMCVCVCLGVVEDPPSLCARFKIEEKSMWWYFCEQLPYLSTWQQVHVMIDYAATWLSCSCHISVSVAF